MSVSLPLTPALSPQADASGERAGIRAAGG